MLIRENWLADPSVNCGEFAVVKTLEFEGIGKQSRNTVEFLARWEESSNLDSKPLEFERFGNETPKAAGNLRDEAGIEQLRVLANLESLNTEVIRMGLTRGERLRKLNATAIRQLQSLSANFALRRLGGADEEPAA